MRYDLVGGVFELPTYYSKEGIERRLW
jgi:hypothetical protein